MKVDSSYNELYRWLNAANPPLRVYSDDIMDKYLLKGSKNKRTLVNMAVNKSFICIGILLIWVKCYLLKGLSNKILVSFAPMILKLRISRFLK